MSAVLFIDSIFFFFAVLLCIILQNKYFIHSSSACFFLVNLVLQLLWTMDFRFHQLFGCCALRVFVFMRKTLFFYCVSYITTIKMKFAVSICYQTKVAWLFTFFINLVFFLFSFFRIVSDQVFVPLITIMPSIVIYIVLIFLFFFFFGFDFHRSSVYEYIYL